MEHYIEANNILKGKLRAALQAQSKAASTRHHRHSIVGKRLEEGVSLDLLALLSVFAHWRAYHRGREERASAFQRASALRSVFGEWGLAVKDAVAERARIALSSNGEKIADDDQDDDQQAAPYDAFDPSMLSGLSSNRGGGTGGLLGAMLAECDTILIAQERAGQGEADEKHPEKEVTATIQLFDTVLDTVLVDVGSVAFGLFEQCVLFEMSECQSDSPTDHVLRVAGARFAAILKGVSPTTGGTLLPSASTSIGTQTEKFTYKKQRKYTEDKKLMAKGQPMQPLHVFGFLAKLYASKAQADMAADKAGQKRARLPEYLGLFFSREYVEKQNGLSKLMAAIHTHLHTQHAYSMSVGFSQPPPRPASPGPSCRAQVWKRRHPAYETASVCGGSPAGVEGVHSGVVVRLVCKDPRRGERLRVTCDRPFSLLCATGEDPCRSPHHQLVVAS